MTLRTTSPRASGAPDDFRRACKGRSWRDRQPDAVVPCCHAVHDAAAGRSALIQSCHMKQQG